MNHEHSIKERCYRSADGDDRATINNVGYIGNEDRCVAICGAYWALATLPN